ncbi:MAG: O-antigen ligase family protein [Candidatus Yanofskybacteria bacterium]|nr:O-antigen ligase family protein [Candidatus Yanofskybacteria bacterium]
MQSQYLFKKLESAVFYLLIFAVPVQARVILYEWTRPFNQWTNTYLYGTDILLVTLFVFWIIRIMAGSWKISNFKFQISNEFLKPKFQILKFSTFWLVIFFVISAISIFNSRIVGLSFYQLLKLAEFIGFYFYLKSNFGKVFQFRTVLVIIIASGLFQAVIGIVQYLKQGSISLRLLGESPLSVNTTGVAIFFAGGEKYLRAYGTTPHPNILAAWLFTTIFALCFYFLHRDTKKNPPEVQRTKDGLLLFVYIILLFALFSTFSRVVVGLWVLGTLAGFLAVFFKKEFRRDLILKQKIFKIFVVSVIAATVFSLIYWPQVNSRIHISGQDPAFSERVFYNKIAESVAVSHPLLGIGIGQFVPDFMFKYKHLPATAYQPVHNIYLLIASETGFIGFSVFLLFLFFSFWHFIRCADFKKLFSFLFFIFSFLFLLVGIFDHFLWTSQQGSLIFWMALALISINSHKISTRKVLLA